MRKATSESFHDPWKYNSHKGRDMELLVCEIENLMT